MGPDWDDIFARMEKAVRAQGEHLPSVSTIAREADDPYGRTVGNCFHSRNLTVLPKSFSFLLP